MSNIKEELENTKKKLRDTPVNKSTETDRARLKTKIARLEDELEKSKSKGGSGKGYGVRKRGDATVSFVGPPSVGKSTILNKLTNADSEVGQYHFTTMNVVPGILEHKGSKIQLLDVPGLIAGAASGKGEGKKVISVVRNSDMVVLVTDVQRLEYIDKMREELYDAGIRLDTERPDVTINEKSEGGVEIKTTRDLSLDDSVIKEVLKSNGILNCDILIREDISTEELIDCVMNNRVYIPSIVVVNKVDVAEPDLLQSLRKKDTDLLLVSAEENINLDKLKEKLWNKLELMRIYMKKKGKEPDKEEPLIINKGSSIAEVQSSLPSRFQKEIDYARVWGKSAKFPGQKVGPNHILQDGDILELSF